MGLRGKRVLITAGPTWVPIDEVRVISNIASGESGLLLAEGLIRKRAKVTLLLGQSGACCLHKKIKLIRFKFFDELKEKLRSELKKNHYDIVLHSAAVSDYRPENEASGKIKSGIRNLKINLTPTVKLIERIKKIRPAVFLVGFKFIPKAFKKNLFQEARLLMRRAGLDLVVANTFSKGRYRAFVLNAHSVLSGPVYKKRDLCAGLIKVIERSL